MTEKLVGYFSQQKRTIFVLFFAMNMSLLVFTGMVWFDFIPGGDGLGFNVQYLGLIPLLISLANFYHLGSEEQLIVKSKNQQPSLANTLGMPPIQELNSTETSMISGLQLYLSSRILSWSLNEMSVICGLIAYLLCGISRHEFLISVAMGVGVNILMRPDVDSFIQKMRSAAR